MNPKWKKLLAAALLVGVGAVWIPQILSAATKTGPTRIRETPALPDAPTRVDAGDPEVPADPLNGAGAALGGGQDDLTSALEATLSRVKGLVPADAGFDLQSLAARATPAVVPPAPPPAVQSTPQPEPQIVVPPAPPERLEIGVVDLAPPHDPAREFLAAHPLEGTLIGAKERRAFLGSRIVRVGDEPIPGLVVRSIEARLVTLAYDGTTLCVELVPFEARPSMNATGAASTVDTQAGVPANPTSQGAPGAPRAEDLSRLLDLLKSDPHPANATQAPEATTGKAQTGPKEKEGP